MINTERPRECSAETMELSSVLPEGWSEIVLGDCATLITKGSTPTSHGFSYKESGIAFVRVENLSKGYIDKASINTFIDATTDHALKRSRLRAGDLLFSIAGTIGRTAIVQSGDLPANTNQALAIIRGANRIFIPEFIKHALRSPAIQARANAEGRGGAMRNISLVDVRAFRLPVPPVAEQVRIVKQLRRLLVSADTTKERLTTLPLILKRFRQSVLAAACSGRLTGDWREQNPGAQTGHDFLLQLLTERKKKWQSVLRRNRRYCDPFMDIAEDLPKLPEKWVWATVDSLSLKVVDGVHKTPKYVSKGIPFITVRSLTAGSDISFEDVSYITEAEHRQFIERANPAKGDLLISKDGTLGVVRAVRTEQTFSIFVSVAMVKPVSTLLTDYLELALSSPQVQAQMTGTGSGLQHIHLRDLKADCVPFPPLAEQQEIVRRVEALFKLADAIEKRAATAQARVDKLTQSILAKAFRGELVPTEAELAEQEGRDYEPASVLLERIHKERESTNARQDVITVVGKAPHDEAAVFQDDCQVDSAVRHSVKDKFT